MSRRAISARPLTAPNDYYAAALKADPHIDVPYHRRIMSLVIDDYDQSIRSLGARRHLVSKYAWAIPNDEALNAIAAWSPIVEVGAGTGYWASLLAACGADVVASDLKPGRNGWCDAPCYFPVVAEDAAVTAARHPDRALFLCWPPMTDMAARALAAYAGRRVIYIGEGVGDCTADDTFFEVLERDWAETVVEIPNWWGVHDALWLYERKE